MREREREREREKEREREFSLIMPQGLLHKVLRNTTGIFFCFEDFCLSEYVKHQKYPTPSQTTTCKCAL